MFPFSKKKTAPKKDKTPAEYERMGRQIESLYHSVYPDRLTFYKMALLRGVLGGVGGVIGATVVIALLLWLLSLFDSVPFIGHFVDTVKNTIESGTQN